MSDARTLHDLPLAEGLYDPASEHEACGIGIVAHLHGTRSRDIVQQALDLVVNLSHRSATGGDETTGDGAGILIQLPHALLKNACRAVNIALPDAGDYGVGMMFVAPDDTVRMDVERTVERLAAARGCRVLGWRDVPTDDTQLSGEARRTRPAIRQVFVAPQPLSRDADDAQAFERTLYVLRRSIERAMELATPLGERRLYIASLSSRTIVYKGLLRPEQLGRFYLDLIDPLVVSGLALVHSRFATNTFPSWARAHPYRFLCHNGEINTLRGNTNWLHVREEGMASDRFGDAMRDILPVIQRDQSDSASLDNVVELLVHAGRPLAHAMTMLLPKAWENDPDMPAARRAFYEYHASLMEPWDGPAAVAFTDGRQIGAIQDRNGLRPARWMLTDDDVLVLSSEAGALPVDPSRVRAKGRLQPGRMLVVNTAQGRLLTDDDVLDELASLRPYGRWVADETHALVTEPVTSTDDTDPAWRTRAFGYTREELQMILGPMALTGEEPVGSMGNDAPLAVLSDRVQSLFSYFRQLFAQVTNPAIDPIRERIVMSLRLGLGPLGNLLDETPSHAHQIQIAHPVIDGGGMAALRSITDPALRARTIAAAFPAVVGPTGLAKAIDAVCRAAIDAVESNDGCGVLIVTDRAASDLYAPVPSLLAISAVHHTLIRAGLRSRVSLVVESGDAREVSHVALLFAYGASAVFPYLALDTCASLARDGSLDGITEATARANYCKAIEKGLLKILSKMGISTLQSYCGAQVWEAVGLGRGIVDRYFTGTSLRPGGIGLEAIAADVLRFHHAASDANSSMLDAGGEYHYRVGGERHAWNPRTIATLQRAAREDNAGSYREFSRLVNDPRDGEASVRSLLDFAECTPVPLDEVEPASEIVRRFATGAMSFGSISREAHETLAEAMNSIGGRSNTGEGGEDPERFGTSRNSAIKQVASARFGVTAEYLVSALELQIKIAQGAKPGEGGQLPGHKVDAVIARIRHSTPGVTLISPPPHHDIYSIEDLKQLIYDLRCVNPTATISVKLVAEAGVGTVAAGVAKAGADLIVVSGDSGGTGASPLSSIKRAGVPWEFGLGETQQTLVLNGLRGHVRLQIDGQLKTGRDVLIAALLGAEEFGFATAPLIVEGCVMMRKCHLNTCPVGIATQDPVLREKFAGKPEHLVNYFFFVAEEARELMARLGLRSMDEAVGRADLLRRRANDRRGRGLDLTALLHMPRGFGARRRRTAAAVGANASTRTSELDRALFDVAMPALERGERVSAALPIRNVHRSVGAAISGEIARRYGDAGLPADTIELRFVGAAGQSFGAFAARGLSLDLEGEANDYVAKGLSGGRVVVRPPKEARLFADGTVIVGNTALYGATAGDVFISGAAGERFAVRNSGAVAVVEGVGDHACEYMTGGSVLVLGDIGRNFAAGMSGGVVFALDHRGQLRARYASSELEFESVAGTEEATLVRQLLERHVKYTSSRRAKSALARWSETIRALVRVIPTEYKRALERASSTVAAVAGTDGPRRG